MDGGVGQERSMQLKWKVDRGEEGLGSVGKMRVKKALALREVSLPNATQLARERSVWRDFVKA